MLFEGINRIYRDYGVFDYPRSGGSRHNGMDIDGVNSFVIRMPSFNGKTISGTVTRSRIVTDHSDSTWEWGYYVTVKLSTPQTVDGTAIHYLTFARNARNLVSDGDTVTTGTPLAIAGKTGNAEGEHIHCHLQARNVNNSGAYNPVGFSGVRDWNDEGCVADYLTRILNKDAFDRSGLIYGLGHAVYTKTDPRCEVFRAYVNHLAAEKGREDELALYANVEKIGKQLLMERQHKSVLSTNIDFYSGFVYEMLGLPKELYTPLFAVARIAGWSAHRMEELSVGGKLIRPRYECVEEHRPYTSMDRR